MFHLGLVAEALLPYLQEEQEIWTNMSALKVALRREGLQYAVNRSVGSGPLRVVVNS